MIGFRLERRPTVGVGARCIAYGAAAVLALAMGTVVFLLSGASPLTAYGVMARGALGSLYDASEVVVKAIPLMLCGLAVAIAGRARLWNVGGEGQLVMGGIGGAAVALFVSPHLAAPWVMPLMAVVGFAAGALWALAAGVLRAKLGVSEILSTLMLNYVAIYWLEHLYFGPWRDPVGMGFPGTAIIPEVAWLPRLGGTRIHIGILFAVTIAVLIQFALTHTRWGYELRVIGASPKAARYAGIATGTTILWGMAVSGGVAGLAGMAEVAGIHFRLQQGLAVGYGYTGIMVAWLARLHPVGILFSGLFVAAILVGGDQLQAVMHLSSSVGLVLEAALVLCVLASEFFTSYRMRRRTETP